MLSSLLNGLLAIIKKKHHKAKKPRKTIVSFKLRLGFLSYTFYREW